MTQRTSYNNMEREVTEKVNMLNVGTDGVKKVSLAFEKERES
jgi:hypothetical protein